MTSSPQRGPAKTGRTGARRWSHHSRAVLAWALASCAVLQLGMGLALATRWSAVRDPDCGHRISLLRKRIAGPERPLTVVVLGSSRTAYGFRAGRLDAPLSQSLGRPVAAFNFGILGTGPVA